MYNKQYKVFLINLSYGNNKKKKILGTKFFYKYLKFKL